MAVTLKQIREKRAEVAKLHLQLVETYNNWTQALTNQETTRLAEANARLAHATAQNELKRMGENFALDEGEDAIQETLNLPEQEEQELPGIDDDEKYPIVDLTNTEYDIPF